jgi:glycosyltransferase involved in cell wall biosynthesis
VYPIVDPRPRLTMPSVTILTQYFPPETGAPQARLSELGERLVDKGWEVQALTALPNYPFGKVFPGYASWRPVVQQVGRIRTVRAPIYPTKRGGALRLASYLSFVVSARVFGPRLTARPDLLYVESPPLFIGYAALSLCRHWGCPYVFNVSDLWPESAVRLGMVKPGTAVRLAARLERKMYRRAIGVTGQSDQIIASVERTAPGTPTVVITNGIELSRFGKGRANPQARALLGPEPGPVFIYAGLMGFAQGLDQVLDLAARLPDDAPGRFVLVGDGPERQALCRRIERERLHRIRVLSPQPRDAVPGLLAAADAAVITLGADLPGAVPSKIYEAMASSRPILLAAGGEAARRVREADAGLTVSPRDAGAFQTAFLTLARDPALRLSLGANGRRAAEGQYSRAAAAERLDRFFRERLASWSATLAAREPHRGAP